MKKSRHSDPKLNFDLNELSQRTAQRIKEAEHVIDLVYEPMLLQLWKDKKAYQSDNSTKTKEHRELLWKKESALHLAMADIYKEDDKERELIISKWETENQ